MSHQSQPWQLNIPPMPITTIPYQPEVVTPAGIVWFYYRPTSPFEKSPLMPLSLDPFYSYKTPVMLHDTRGVILAGGKGTRMGALTKTTNKHLLPVGNEPMIYHPVRKLVGAGITKIMIVTGTEHMGDFVDLLGSGKELGCSITYRVQDEAGGIAQALGLAEDFCFGRHVMVLLGDNIFYSPLKTVIVNAKYSDAHLTLKRVDDPTRYGVAKTKYDHANKEVITDLEEKPANAQRDTHEAVTGIYVYPPDVFTIIRTLKPSARGELEITDVNNYYMRNGRLGFTRMAENDKEDYWTDAGTVESWHYANKLVKEQPPKY